MGKVRVAPVGDEEATKKLEAKKAAKKLLKQASVKPTDDSLQTTEPANNQQSTDSSSSVDQKPKAVSTAKKKKPTTSNKPKRSEKYNEVRLLVDKAKKYSLSEALDILPTLQRAKFDETVELHINTTSSGINGTITLPHGTGKKVRVAIATDALLAEVEKGKIDFDILVAAPQMMPKLAKVARVLGPRGLMPNPKNGTVTPNPEEVVKKFEGGQMSYKTESKMPIIHVVVGKVSFGKEKLSDNVKAMLFSVGSEKVKSVTLKSTMSPGIKLSL